MNPPGDVPPADDDGFYITIVNYRRNSLIFKVKTTTRLERIIRVCASRWDLDANTLVLMYDRHSFTMQSTLTVGGAGLLVWSNMYCCTNDTTFQGTYIQDVDSEEDPTGGRQLA